MTRVKLVGIVGLINFYKRVFNQFENIPRQNKDTEVVSVPKICLLELFLSTL